MGESEEARNGGDRRGMEKIMGVDDGVVWVDDYMHRLHDWQH